MVRYWASVAGLIRPAIPETELAAGHLLLSYKYTPPPPLERLTFETEITSEYLLTPERGQLMSKIEINRITNANIYLDGTNLLGRAGKLNSPMSP